MLQHVAAELLVVALVAVQLVAVPAFEGRLGLVAPLVGRQHLGDEEFRQAVVVQVGQVGPHAALANLGEVLGQCLPEGAVALVVVEVIALEVIVADEQVGPAVLVHVPHRYPQSEADVGRVDTGGGGDVLEAGRTRLGQQVLEELITALRVGHLPQPLAQVVARGSPGAVVQQVAIQVTVAVVVEEGGVYRKAYYVQSVVRAGLAEGQVALIDKQLVVPHAAHARNALPGGRTGLAHVEVLQTVGIDVDHRHPGRPTVGAGHAGPLGHVLEAEISEVAVQFILDQVTRQVDVDQAITVEVADPDPAAVVEIAVGIGVQLVRVGKVVAEGDAGVGLLRRGHPGEALPIGRGRKRSLFLTTAGQAKQHKRHVQESYHGVRR